MARVRYARVPTGMETCTFCTMLASRGFVYRSEESAGHAQHRGCDCLIMPGVQGETKIDGYDPDTLYDLWQDFLRIDGDVIRDDEGEILTGRSRQQAVRAMKERAILGKLHRPEFDSTLTDDDVQLIGEYIHGLYGKTADYTGYVHGDRSMWTQKDSEYLDFYEAHDLQDEQYLSEHDKQRAERLYQIVMNEKNDPTTLIRVEDYEPGTLRYGKTPEVGQTLTFGVKSAADDANFAVAFAEGVPGLGAPSETAEIQAYRINDATRYLDVHTFSEFDDQHEALFAGSYRVTGIERATERVQVGEELEKLTLEEKAAREGWAVERYESNGSNMVRVTTSRGTAIERSERDFANKRNFAGETKPVYEEREIVYIDLEEIPAR